VDEAGVVHSHHCGFVSFQGGRAKAGCGNELRSFFGRYSMPVRFAQEEAPPGLEPPRQGFEYAQAFGGGDVVQDEVDHHSSCPPLGWRRAAMWREQMQPQR
jgi:hypothetical protein